MRVRKRSDVDRSFIVSTYGTFEMRKRGDDYSSNHACICSPHLHFRLITERPPLLRRIRRYFSYCREGCNWSCKMQGAAKQVAPSSRENYATFWHIVLEVRIRVYGRRGRL